MKNIKQFSVEFNLEKVSLTDRSGCLAIFLFFPELVGDGVQGAYLPTLPVFPGVSKFFYQISRSPGYSTKSPGKYLTWLFSIFLFVIFVFFEDPKRKIKQEVDLVLLFELFSIGKHRKTGNRALISTYI